MGYKIKGIVDWVGKVDWELRTFHGEELSTHRGSSYNAYLIRDEKTVLIDTSWAPFAEEFVENLKKEIDLNKIDYIISLHSEIDHSGALPQLMKEIPDTPIYCTTNGAKFIKSQYHKNWNFVTVKTGDKLSIGSQEIIFIEAPMLHWPDTMFCYLTGEKILFSSDAFGQHYAAQPAFNDLVDEDELYQEAIKYYANIVAPFSPMVERKIKEVLDLNLPIEMICPAHGVIWRDNPAQIVETYLKWAKNYAENQITIVYGTMWDATKIMAEAIAQGIAEEDPSITVKLYNIGVSDKNDVITEIFKSKAVLVGSSTFYNGMLSEVAGLLEEVRCLKLGRGKKAAAFGAYGWSGESVKLVSEALKAAGFELVNDGIRELWKPDEKALENCINFGKNFLKSI
ncbi:MAG TPA: MBL fold hydrolase [Peptococcaceae bacterium]|nr:MAG: putative flavoprotein [Clostridia bacterium 41_269]HBT20639.1 MBL fold hydrolase [Peptococcaceae bacterium]